MPTQSSSLIPQKIAYLLCEEFANLHELPVDYVWAEFANPEVDSLQTVTEALDMADQLVYS